MSEMLKRLSAVMEIVDGEHDNLCIALMALSARGGITIVPRDDNLITNPVIIVPKRLYDRMLKLSNEQ